jgi:hypothetical protein
MEMAMRALAFGMLTALIIGAWSPAANAAGEGITGLVFDEVERRAIEDFFGKEGNRILRKARGEDDDGPGKKHKKKGKKGKKKGLPPGLAKKDELPPGLQKQLERNGRLPPGLEKRRLPYDLERRLKRRWDEEAIIVDDDVLLVRKATGLIIDIIKDVVR